MATNRKISVIGVIVFISISYIAVAYIRYQKSPEAAQRKVIIDMAVGLLKTVEAGDMIVAKGKNTRITFIATSKFDGQRINGYAPFYLSTINKLLIGDLVGIVGDDNYGKMFVVSAEYVPIVLSAMFDIGENFHK